MIAYGTPHIKRSVGIRNAVRELNQIVADRSIDPRHRVEAAKLILVVAGRLNFIAGPEPPKAPLPAPADNIFGEPVKQ